MALFTVLLEFDGGTYISQVRAASITSAVQKYAGQVVGIDVIGTLSTRKKLAMALREDSPVPIEGILNVWCCSAAVGRKMALANFVATRK